jgi:hypothetical protein
MSSAMLSSPNGATICRTYRTSIWMGKPWNIEACEAHRVNPAAEHPLGGPTTGLTADGWRRF